MFTVSTERHSLCHFTCRGCFVQLQLTWQKIQERIKTNYVSKRLLSNRFMAVIFIPLSIKGGKCIYFSIKSNKSGVHEKRYKNRRIISSALEQIIHTRLTQLHHTLSNCGKMILTAHPPKSRPCIIVFFESIEFQNERNNMPQKCRVIINDLKFFI